MIDSGSSSQQQYQAAQAKAKTCATTCAPSSVNASQCYSQFTSYVSVPRHEYPKAYLLTCRRHCFTLPFDPAHMLSESCWLEWEGGHLASPSWPRHLTACSCISQRLCWLTLGAFYTRTRTRIRMRMLHTPATGSRLQHFSHSIALATFSHRITRHGSHHPRQQIAPSPR